MKQNALVGNHVVAMVLEDRLHKETSSRQVEDPGQRNKNDRGHMDLLANSVKKGLGENGTGALDEEEEGHVAGADVPHSNHHVLVLQARHQEDTHHRQDQFESIGQLTVLGLAGKVLAEEVLDGVEAKVDPDVLEKVVPLAPELGGGGGKAREVVTDQGPFGVVDEVTGDGSAEDHDGVVEEGDVKDNHGGDTDTEEEGLDNIEVLDILKGDEAHDKGDDIHEDGVKEPTGEVGAPMLRVRVNTGSIDLLDGLSFHGLGGLIRRASNSLRLHLHALLASAAAAMVAVVECFTFLTLDFTTKSGLLKLELKSLELLLAHGDLSEGLPDLCPPVLEVHSRLLAGSPRADIVKIDLSHEDATAGTEVSQLEDGRVRGCEDEREGKETSDERGGKPLFLTKGKREEEEDVEATAKDEEEGEVEGVGEGDLSGGGDDAGGDG